ncbi:3-oxoacyl-[acyl-carrier-protein] reductase FabG [Paenibacillus konkukensis]|uniref:3-oxoacyl-[acyl-carrier-protein] reductase FabG n=1 Tax=Paenibacillus konkukensis TaxID=2020716 RepID=A0ABY4RMF7_9BACL|nr:3-oxoacyl-[acyl-carrier-protein] reductase FabG [Paenibacillus konkukensis]
MITTDLTGQIALVTGGNAGIGFAIARKLSQAGAKVAINYLSKREAAEQAVRTIREEGGTAECFQADVTRIAGIEALISQVERTLGGTVDILVNNAGHMIERVPNAEMTEERYNQIMDVNLKSTVFLCKAVLPGMTAKGKGKIVNMASLAAHNGGGPGASVYAASKAAVLAYSKGLAKEAAPHGIGVNVLSPGFIGQTAFHSTFTSDQARKATVAGIPLGREGTPEDVANCALFLASPLSDYLTGETIEINGGMFMR